MKKGKRDFFKLLLIIITCLSMLLSMLPAAAAEELSADTPPEEGSDGSEEVAEVLSEPEAPAEGESEEGFEEEPPAENEEEAEEAEEETEEENELSIPEDNSGIALISETGELVYVPDMNTAAQLPIRDIAEGGIYVTVRDTDGNIVDSTISGSKPENIQKVDLGQGLTVQLDFPQLKDGDQIGDDVYYYLDLPAELVPDTADSSGRQLFDPENPIELCHQGEIRAWGGIYNAGDAYRFLVYFENTAEQVEISASFQYTAAVSKSLTPGETYTGVSFGAAGLVAFTVKEEARPEATEYSLNIEGVWDDEKVSNAQTHSTCSTLDWTATVSVSGENPSLESGSTLTLSADGGHGIVIQNMYASVDMSRFKISVTYADGTKADLSCRQTDYAAADFYNGDAKLLTLTLPEYKYGQSSSDFILGTVNVVFDPNGAGSTEGIAEYRLSFSTEAYDNLGSDAALVYKLSGALDADSSKEGAESSDEGTATKDWGVPSVDYATEPGISNAFSNLPESVSDTITVSQSNYGGNYFTLTFTPNRENSLGANYYCNNLLKYGTDRKGNKVQQDNFYGDYDSFIKSVTIDGEEYSKYYCYSTTLSDLTENIKWNQSPVLAKQLETLLSADSYYVMRIVPNASDTSEDIYIVVAPDTYTNAKNTLVKEWVGYSQNVGSVNDPYNTIYDRESGSWTVYVFNAAGKDVEFKFNENLGEVNDLTDTDGTVANEVTVAGKTNSYSSRRAGWSVETENPISITSEYAVAYNSDENLEESANWICWNLDVNLSNWEDEYSMRGGYLYLTVPDGLAVYDAYSLLVPLKSGYLPAGFLQYMKADGSWGNAGSLTLGTDGIYCSYPFTPEACNDGKLHLRFYTEVVGDVNGDYEIKAQLKFYSGDLATTEGGWSYISHGVSGNSLFTFCASNTGSAPAVKLSKKSVRDVDSGIDAMSAKRWTIESDTQPDSAYLNGVWQISDKMDASTVSNSGGETVESVSPGSYTKLAGDITVTVTSSGGDVALRIPEEAIKSAINAADSDALSCAATASEGDVTAELKLTRGSADDEFTMQSGFTLTLSGLKNVSHVTAEYTTLTDDAALIKALTGGNDTSVERYKVSLTNGVICGWTQKQGSPTVKTTEYNITAALALSKEAGESKKSVGGEFSGAIDGATRPYTVEATVGVSPSAYLRLTDYLQGYTDSNGDTYSLADAEGKTAVSTLAGCFSVSGLRISVKEPGGGSTTVWENGAAVSGCGYTVSLTMRDKLGSAVTASYPGALYQLKIEKDGGKIPAETVVTVSYDGTVQMDSFRASDYYSGGTLAITNNVSGARDYTSSADTASANILKAFGLRRTSDDGSESSRSSGSGNVRGLELVCTAGSGVAAEYLSGKSLIKEGTGSSGHYEYYLAELTEQYGKGYATAEITDTLSAFSTEANIEALTENGYTEAAARAALDALDAVLRRHTTFSALEILYDTGDGTKTNKDTAAVYTQSGTLTDGEGSFDGDKTAKVTVSPDNSFKITVSGLDYGDIVAAKYAADIDWAGFYADEAVSAYISNNALALTPAITNTASDGGASKSSKSEDKIEIYGLAAGKTVDASDEDNANGVAHWTVTADTGYAPGGTLTITDMLSVKVGETAPEALSAAAEKATGIEHIKLADSDGTIIYENGAVTEAAMEKGWAAANVSVKVSGTALTAVLTDNAAKNLLGSGKSFVLSYDSMLDKDLFLSSLIDAGLTGEQIKAVGYTLANSALVEMGGASASAGKETEQKPKFPVKIKKTAESDASDTAAVNWAITAETGSAARRDFTISDSLTEPASALPCISITAMTITVKTGEQSAVTIYDTASGLDMLAQYQAELTGRDGEAFALGVDGVYGYSLSFSTLPGDSSVTVEYKTALNRDEYLRISGADVAPVLKNSASVSSADGWTDDAEASKTIVVSDIISKTGEKLPGKSSGGNDVIQWTININLRDEYTEEQLLSAKSVKVVDVLNSGLGFIENSLIANDMQSGEALEESVDYQLTPPEDTNANELTVALLTPAEHSAVQLVFQTEALTNIDALYNTAYLELDGKSYRKTTEGKMEVYSAEQSGYVRSNSKVKLSGTKTWLDDDDASGLRPESITVRLYADGVELASKAVTASDNWSYCFSADDSGKYLLKYKNGQPITYTVSEDAVSDYTSAVNGYDITNTLSPGETDISVRKVWQDGEDADGLRPDEITVRLLANDADTGITLTLSAKNNWTGSFTKLPEYENGKKISYTVEEMSVPDGYAVAITGSATEGWTITNTHTPAPTPTPTPSTPSLPQTGQNWRLVGCLLLAGAAMLLAGILSSKKSRGKHDA